MTTGKLEDIQCFLLDMDGTIYLGNELIDGAREFLERIKRENKKYLFLTNNSSKNSMDYVRKLKKLGIEVNQEDIFTSGEAASIYLKEKLPIKSKIFVLGTESFEKELENAGFLPIHHDGEDLSEVKAVVLGFDTSLTYKKLWIACDLIREKKQYIATHPDLNCPIEGGKFMPDIGAMIAFIEASTGIKPKIIGKPNGIMIDMICKKYGLRHDALAIVGDRLYTDIKTGENADICSILVLSGETKIEDYKVSSIHADYVFPSVKELAESLNQRR